MLTWHAQLPPGVCGVFVLSVVLCLIALSRRITQRLSRPRAVAVLVPKAVILLLLLVAMLDPACVRRERMAFKRQLLIVTDRSSSMDVRDGNLSRAERAERLVVDMEKALQTSYAVRRLEFDSVLQEPDAVTERTRLRETDIGATLLTLAERSDVSPDGAIILVTDGGDERVDCAVLPSATLHVIGVGTDPKTWDDTALAAVDYPASVEKGTDFEIQAEIAVRATRTEKPVGTIDVRLERQEGEQWQLIEEKKVKEAGRLFRLVFKTSCREAGTHVFRVSVRSGRNEMSLLNNQRTFSVEAQSRRLHVLYFARELGSDFKMIRNELGSDPGLTFSALFRTIGERFTIQGERLEGDEELEAGFPGDVRTLRLYDCVIIGAFPASQWKSEQMQALIQYVRDGGAVIFLGGEASFGLGGYGLTPLAALIPWEMSPREKDLIRGELPVSIPVAALAHPIMAGLSDLLGGSTTVSAANPVGPVKPAATVLMSVSYDERWWPLIVLQRFGEGSVLAIASNTLWKWPRESAELQRAYGLFWRQAVRNLTGREEGGRILAVRWNRPSYRPGEEAIVEMRVAGRHDSGPLVLSATLVTNSESRSILLEAAQGQQGTWSARLHFKQRGSYKFILVARHSGQVIETYEKTITVGPRAPEGSNLELDEKFLASLADRTGGIYVHESQAHLLTDTLLRGGRERMVTTESSIVCGYPWFAVLVLFLLLVEWITRRRLNLL